MSKNCVKKVSGVVLAVMTAGVCIWTLFVPAKVLTFYVNQENKASRFTDFQIVDLSIDTRSSNLEEWMKTYNFPDSTLED
ncbi:MAG: hypothetical protein CO183_01215 [Candidatus Zambryskibacteria bacterium CG_4_9_14_3_um_filter_42_9]|uniref:Uncharacterized protein n=1 Tax=Candidatus Zambryskibacteria bacterium CG22_combo_CG10-13_8_21_14_all_42_17 TaxID=1975118 RepID=A0A2H0BE52_9BACT|nr:MAG: hypothetical protein COX06_00510 [Candidatus Zambryskibacteria bacterium CG22_combo_CG10-13_8_21_14_all_42_17]PJA36869.1 MAG: hypothetical protein CO183_01215 [Candidatus Zambryskibacteria bacterium CG_4_9_14_3_um_filter_42_9]